MKPKPFIFAKRFPIPLLFSYPFSPQQQRFPFSTHNRHSFDEAVPGCSAVYQHVLKFQRPPTIRWSPHLENTASFIGTVAREPTRVNSTTGKCGVYTVLKVPKSNQSNSSFFRLLLMMRNNVAKLASEHLKLNDFIQVLGSLGSFTKPDANGILRLNYKVHYTLFQS
ncbi:Protein OSB1, mitochondrial isoform I [Glycine soja]|uniref:Protein OSB1, mitochondrial isoform I n=1 Tax=Glycine soja TaxID=3848 RepID=A0A445H349_GLYSO|nr:Protein OSB1, mitochondrial isoform I [Glycine soja]